MENHLSIYKVAVIAFTFISEFFKPYFGQNLPHHFPVSQVIDTLFWTKLKLPDFYTLSHTKLVKNHTLHSGTYLPGYIWEYPPPQLRQY